MPSEGRGFEKLFRALRQPIGSSARHHAESWCWMYMLTTRWETVLRGTCSAISRAWATQNRKPFLCLSGPPRLWALPRETTSMSSISASRVLTSADPMVATSHPTGSCQVAVGSSPVRSASKQCATCSMAFHRRIVC